MKNILSATSLILLSLSVAGCSTDSEMNAPALDVEVYEAPSNWGTVSNPQYGNSFKYPTDLYDYEFDFDITAGVMSRAEDQEEVFTVNTMDQDWVFSPSVSEEEIEMWDEIRGTASWLTN